MGSLKEKLNRTCTELLIAGVCVPLERLRAPCLGLLPKKVRRGLSLEPYEELLETRLAGGPQAS